jgi:hypothetical protein
VCAVTGQVNGFKNECPEVAVDLFVDSLDEGVLLFRVCQSEVVRSANVIKELLDQVIGKVRSAVSADEAGRAEATAVL